jgi:hypothetical protein
VNDEIVIASNMGQTLTQNTEEEVSELQSTSNTKSSSVSAKERLESLMVQFENIINIDTTILDKLFIDTSIIYCILGCSKSIKKYILLYV